MADWNLQPRAAACVACGAAFSPGDSGHSLLLREDEAWLRRDLCPACFAALPKGAVQSAVSAWAFAVPKAAKGKVREEPLRRESAERLLRTLMARGDPRDLGAAYVLAILLERGKRFVERSVTTDAAGRRVRLYEQRGTGDLFPVIDPGLKAEDIAAVQRRVLELLEGGADAPTGRPRAKVLRRGWTRRVFPVLRRGRRGARQTTPWLGAGRAEARGEACRGAGRERPCPKTGEPEASSRGEGMR